MKIDPYVLISQFVEYHIGVINDWVKWVQLERSLPSYQSMLRKTVAANDPYTFFESRLDEFLSDYDRKEKKILGDYIKLIGWFKDNRISEATRKIAVDSEMYEKRKEIEKMIAGVNGLATDLIGDCKKIGYAGNSLAFLEVLANQNATEVIAMYIRHA